MNDFFQGKKKAECLHLGQSTMNISQMIKKKGGDGGTMQVSVSTVP